MKMLRNKLNSTKGITLVSLVVTIIILIILAGVTINMTIGEAGIFTKAKQAKENFLLAANTEAELLRNAELSMGMTNNDEENKGDTGDNDIIPSKEYNIFFEGINATMTGEKTVKEKETYKAIIEPENAYAITDLKIKMGNKELEENTDYSYIDRNIVIWNISADIQINASTEKILLSKEAYGELVDYSANGVTSWRLFYTEEDPDNPYYGCTYIIYNGYLPTSKIPSTLSGGYYTVGQYALAWKSTVSAISVSKENQARFKYNIEVLTMDRYVSNMLSSTAWDIYAQGYSRGGDIKGAYAIGSPTLELFAESWKKLNPGKKMELKQEKYRIEC